MRRASETSSPGKIGIFPSVSASIAVSLEAFCRLCKMFSPPGAPLN